MKTPPKSPGDRRQDAKLSCLHCQAGRAGAAVVCGRCERRLRAMAAGDAHPIDQFIVGLLQCGRRRDRHRWFQKQAPLLCDSVNDIKSEMSILRTDLKQSKELLAQKENFMNQMRSLAAAELKRLKTEDLNSKFKIVTNKKSHMKRKKTILKRIKVLRLVPKGEDNSQLRRLLS